MRKFVIAAVAAAALSTTANPASCASSFSGFYAGLQAGINSAHSKIRDGDSEATKESHGAQSFIGGLFTGYGMGVGQCMYVGGEIYGNLGANNLTYFDSNTTKITAKNNGNLGVKVRLGYVASPQAMIFLGLGLEYAQWKLKIENISRLARGVETEYKSTISKVAFSPSVGTEVYMNKHLFVRGEYTYVAPVVGKLEGKTWNDSNITIKSNTNQHRFALGLGYKF